MSVLEIVLLCCLGSIVCLFFVCFMVCALTPDKEVTVIKNCLLFCYGSKVYKIFGFDGLYLYIFKNHEISRIRRSEVRRSNLLDDSKYFCFKIDEL